MNVALSFVALTLLMVVAVLGVLVWSLWLPSVLAAADAHEQAYAQG